MTVVFCFWQNTWLQPKSDLNYMHRNQKQFHCILWYKQDKSSGFSFFPFFFSLQNVIFHQVSDPQKFWVHGICRHTQWNSTHQILQHVKHICWNVKQNNIDMVRYIDNKLNRREGKKRDETEGLEENKMLESKRLAFSPSWLVCLLFLTPRFLNECSSSSKRLEHSWHSTDEHDVYFLLVGKVT